MFIKLWVITSSGLVAYDSLIGMSSIAFSKSEWTGKHQDVRVRYCFIKCLFLCCMCTCRSGSWCELYYCGQMSKEIESHSSLDHWFSTFTQHWNHPMGFENWDCVGPPPEILLWLISGVTWPWGLLCCVNLLSCAARGATLAGFEPCSQVLPGNFSPASGLCFFNLPWGQVFPQTGIVGGWEEGTGGLRA